MKVAAVGAIGFFAGRVLAAGHGLQRLGWENDRVECIRNDGGLFGKRRAETQSAAMKMKGVSKYIMAASLAAGLATVASAATPGRTLDPEDLFEQLWPSVVVVLGSASDDEGSLGSGVVVAQEMVATNCHVLTGQKVVEVDSAGELYAATLRGVDWRRDVCILHVPGLDAPVVQIAKVESLRIGQKVYAIGAPQGLDFTLTDGLVSGFRELEYGVVIQTSAPISQGSSGGGLFDANGRLIGLTTSMVEEGHNLNFAHPVDWVIDLLQTMPRNKER